MAKNYFVKCNAIEIRRSEKLQCDYKLVTWRQWEEDDQTGKIRKTDLVKSVVLFPEHTAMVNGKSEKFKASLDYGDIMVDDEKSAELIEVPTTPYSFENSRVMMTSITVMVPPKRDAVEIAAKELRRFGAGAIRRVPGKEDEIVKYNPTKVAPKQEQEQEKKDPVAQTTNEQGGGASESES